MTKDALSQRLLGTFGSVNGIDTAITTIWLQGLPEDYYQQYAKQIAAITKERRAARREAVRGSRPPGDRDRRRPEVDRGRLKATGIAPIVILDSTGAPAGTM